MRGRLHQPRDLELGHTQSHLGRRNRMTENLRPQTCDPVKVFFRWPVIFLAFTTYQVGGLVKYLLGFHDVSSSTCCRAVTMTVAYSMNSARWPSSRCSHRVRV